MVDFFRVNHSQELSQCNRFELKIYLKLLLQQEQNIKLTFKFIICDKIKYWDKQHKGIEIFQKRLTFNNCR